MPNFDKIYADHVVHKNQIYSDSAAENNFQQIVIGSGSQNLRFRDDLHTPYYANSYFEEFVSLPDRPNSFLVIEPGSKPKLFIQNNKSDYWHSEPEPIDEFIAQQFDVQEFVDTPDIRPNGRTAFIGDNHSLLPSSLVDDFQSDADSVLEYIDFNRACKTDYEKDCLREANKQAAAAHLVAKRCFEGGCSEYDIHMAYLSALKSRDSELPYDNIIALNEHAAVLHHMHLSKAAPEQFRSFLIDAGARCQGYAADVTRTYVTDNDDSCFSALINATDSLQQKIVEQIVILEGKKLAYSELHHLANELIATVLVEFGFVTVGADEALDRGIVNAFFPHGLGHLLGIQVHDKGGYMTGVGGRLKSPPENHPHLRMTREIEKDMVFTIEPGIYFVPKLLAQWRDKQVLNESLIEQMIPYGGVRIEDNIIVGQAGPENITRDAFSAVV